MKTKWWLVSFALLLMACNLGPLLLGSTPTATPTPSVAATYTESPSAVPTAFLFPTQGPAPTAYFIPTQIPPPTAITCPKGTELNKSTNTCFYVTRTPKPAYCPDYKGKLGCESHGCTWNAKSGTCS